MRPPRGRTLRELAAQRWEAVLTAALFLGCTYGAVFFIVTLRLAAAGAALICAAVFAKALMGFLYAAALRRGMGLDQVPEHLEGE